MKCDRCNQRDASIHIVKMSSQGQEQLNLCPVCAREYQKEMGGTPAVGINSSHLIHEILNHPEKFGLKIPFGTVAGPVCPECGTTLKDIREKGLAGCPRCYQVFAPLLEQIIANVQKADHHSGRVPEKMREKLETDREIARLREEIGRLVEEERYEEAAAVRDQIRGMEHEGFHTDQ